jgi:hypothetical protein
MSDTEYLSGGTIRVGGSAAHEAAIPAPESERVYTGVVRSDGSGQVVRDTGALSAVTGAGVMATVRNCMGGQRIDSTSTVEVNGMRTSLKVAEQLGYIRQVSPGRYEDSADASMREQQEQQATAASEQLAAPELFDAQTEADWSADIEPLPQAAFDSAVAGAANAVLSEDGEGWDTVVKRLATNANIDSNLAAEYVSVGYSLYEGQVAKMAEGYGIVGDEKEAFYEYLRTSKRSELTAAVQALTVQRRLDGFRLLAQAYKTRNKA